MNIDAQQSVSSPDSWLVSFGDLLTLLLCFFVSSLSASSFGFGSQVAKNTEESKDNASSLAARQGQFEDGKALAEKSLDPVSLEIGFAESDFTETSDILAQAKSKLRVQLAEISDEFDEIQIQSCSQEQLGLEANWQVSRLRAENLLRQISDYVKPNGNYAIEVLGPNCIQIGADLVAKIFIKRNG